MPDLDGETAIVTGAAQGFGRATAERLGEHGANVVIADVQVEKAEEAGEELREQGISTEVVECDVTDEESVDAMVDRVVDRFGSIEILVNNAGGAGSDRFSDLDLEDWQAGVDLNLTGPFIVSSAVAPVMNEHGNGRIVNISSMAGKNVTLHGDPSYTASKWGLIGLTKHMARDLGPEVRVNAICPGGGPTAPVGRAMTGDDVADTVLLLVSDLADYVDAVALSLDGGSHLNERPDYLDDEDAELPDFLEEQ